MGTADSSSVAFATSALLCILTSASQFRLHIPTMRPKKLCFFTFTFFTLSVLRVDSTQPPFACDSSNPSTKAFPFCETTLPISQRARDLVSRLTLDEKISQLVNSAPPIPRLGIPGYEWWSEALHGVSSAGPGIHFNDNIKGATSFPQVILTAASFDAYQWYRIGQAIGKEARALYNAGQATGMTFWAPNINIFRDPRWGRGQETPGEDPLVTGRYAASYVKGVQGDSFEGGKIKGHLQASACCKHFTAYDLDNWKGMNRFVFDARVTMQDLADTYQPPFKSCVEQGRASGIMCGYNKVNGVPSCADSNLLSNTARAQWGFRGYITSDCDAVSIIHDDQGYAKSPEDAVVDVLKAGMDVNCGSYLLKHAKVAVEQKKLSESDIDKALHNLFSVRMRLGLFNGHPEGQLFGNIGPDQVCSQEHQILALEAARNGIVLLKNSARLLPLSKSKTKSLAVIGPNANSGQMLLGNYAGPPCRFVTPLQALQSYIKQTVYHPACDTVQCSSASVDRAVDVAKGTDHVVLMMGLDQTQEREELDRTDLLLPGKQQELIIAVAKAAKNPVVLVLFSGGPIDISFAKNDKNIGSILWAGYPGEGGAIALAEIMFGDHNPGKMALFFTSHSSLFFSPSSSINPNNPFPLPKSPQLPSLSFSCKSPKTLRFHPQITKQPRFPTHLTRTSSSVPSSDPDPEPNPTPLSITDEWGEKAEPEPEYPKNADSDPPRNDDEWGEQFVDAGNGTAAAPSTSSAVVVEKDGRIEDLKRCLVDTVYGTEFGFRATPEIRAEVLELVNQLEAVNPTSAPVDATGVLDGKWVLVYTAFSELLPLLAAGATPLLKVKSISQIIDSSILSIVNSTTLSSPFATFSFSASATFEVRTPSRIQVEFKEGTLQPPEINSNIDLPENVELFGQKINLSPVQQSLNPLQEAAANIGRTISGQPPLKVPIPGNQASSWLLITYLDEDLRISRGDGGLFVLAKEGSPLLEL